VLESLCLVIKLLKSDTLCLKFVLTVLSNSTVYCLVKLKPEM